MTNPLLRTNDLPPFGEIQAEHMLPAVQQVLAEVRSGIDLLLENKPYKFAGLVKGREELEDRLHQVFSPIAHLNAVMNSPEIRAAYEDCLALVTEYHTEIGQNKPLFEAYQVVRNAADFDSLSDAARKTVDNALLEFRLSGIDLDSAGQARFAELANRLSSHNSTFNNHVLDASQAWSRQITDESELDGLPDNALAMFRQKAQERELDGWLLTLDIPSYIAVTTYCNNRSLRQEMYTAYGTRASHLGPQAGEFDNSEVMLEILNDRLEQSRLLGFNNFAEMSIERKMARSTQEVLEFLTDLATRSRPYAYEELAEIQAFAKQLEGPEPMAAWDIAYYAEKLKEQRFEISDEELRPYFPAPTVLNGMFEVSRRLFDVEVVAAEDMPVWHPDVQSFALQRDGQTIARCYIDLFARAGKQGGAWMDDCRVRRTDLNGNLHIPVAYLTCNFTGPVGDDPALLSHDEVVTLFHEFGHGLHHMMTQIDVAPVSGINGVAWDAVELPSQFMENFCWQQESLALISGHYQTAELLPESMLQKLLNARNFQAAMMMVRQVEFALFDFRLHLMFDPDQKDQVQSTIEAVREEVAVVQQPKEHAFQHGFSHIFGGGYAAGYYSYKWAEVLSADAFAKFLEDGIFNRQTGEKFLSTVLERGGAEDAMDLFIAFRGREPDVTALLRQEGLEPSALPGTI